MRDYLYLHHDASQQFIVASGLELKDLFRKWPAESGIVWLDHQLEDYRTDPSSGLDYALGSEVLNLSETCFYEWGNFSFADYYSPDFPPLTKADVAELLYFSHSGTPFAEPGILGLGNRLLVCGHDDGWRLTCYYSDWHRIVQFLQDLTVSGLPLDPRLLSNGNGTYWFDHRGLRMETHSDDMDAILMRNIK